MNVKLKIAFAALLCINLPAFSQLMLDDINFDLIHQKKIRKYIEGQIQDNKHMFSEIHPSWKEGKDLSFYSKNEKKYFLKDSIQKVWKAYLSADPTRSWSGHKVSFGLLLNKYPENIYYEEDHVEGVDTGQVYYLNLKILEGCLNVPVAFEVVKVDDIDKVIEFSYLEGNKSNGVQRIEFIDLGNGCTQISHISYFKSDSHFRDRWIYPFFHKKIINEFHKNIRKLFGL
jgi:hypothetical protein